MIKRTSIINALVVIAVIALTVTGAHAVSFTVDGDEELGGGHSGAHDFFQSAPGDHDEDAHWSWVDPTPPAALTNVNYFIDDHGGGDALSAAQVARIQDAAGVWNTSGANVSLTEVAADGLADLHVHGDSTSGCGAGAIGCAETTWWNAHNPAGYADGHPQHLMAGNQDGANFQVLTMYTRGDWYTGADPLLIVGGELDYLSVAIQEFGHQLGLAHNDSGAGHPFAEYDISPMNGILDLGTTPRTLQLSDLTAITHLYGEAAAVPEPSTLLLLGSGLLGLGILKARRGRRNQS